MDIFQWFLQKSGSELTLHLQSNANSELFIVYVMLCLIIKKPPYLMAFFISCLFFEWSLFDNLAEYNLYLMTFAIYSFVFQSCVTDKSKIACAIILLLTIVFAIDSMLYGVNGYYGASDTVIYSNVEYLSTYAHLFFIYSLVDLRRIKNNLRNFIGHVLYMSRNSAYYLIC